MSLSFTPFASQELEGSIPARFFAQVRRHASRTAVRSRGCRLSYAELNRAANRVAGALLARGGEELETVGLLFQPGAPQIAAILGALKAGRIFLLLDPSQPRAYSASLLEDARAPYVVTSAEHAALAREIAPDRAEVLDTDTLPAGADDDPRLDIAPDRPCWIVYTSGSSGRPKGVLKSHRNVLTEVRNYSNATRLCPSDRLSFINPRDIFLAVLNGAAAYPENTRREGLAAQARWLREEDVTVFHSVPTGFRHLLDTLAEGETLPSVRLVRLIGEPVRRLDVELFRKHFAPECLFVNAYGTSEAGYISLCILDRASVLKEAIVPSGYALEGKRVTVVGDDGRPVAPGEVGDIVVSGRSLSLGYWRDPKATNAAFHKEGDVLVNRTGDLGRLGSDGCLVHLGRKDSQVKVRGNRVELAEVEMALDTLHGVRQSVVLDQTDETGAKRLVAYVVPEGGAPTAGALRAGLAEQVPDTMVPAAFVVLDRIPRTESGKVDKNALPAPDAARPALDDAFVAPRDDVERRLAGIWEQVLKVERVGIEDNFFELGGDSLLAVSLLGRIEAGFGRTITAANLVEAPTVAALARALQQEEQQEGSSCIRS